MQQYIANKTKEIETKYNQQEYSFRIAKDADCLAITNSKKKQEESNKTKKRIFLVISEIIALLIGVPIANNNNSGVIVLVLCVIAYCVVYFFFRNIGKQLESSTQSKLTAREAQLSHEIQQIQIQKASERKQLEADINNKMNQYRKTFERNKTSEFLVEWLLNVLDLEIKKADRSKWLPQVKAKLRFVVSHDNIEIPGFGKYDMASQGIFIDNNPMATGALAYVLEKKTLAEAQRRFQVDPNRGRPVFTSTRNDTHVEIMYSAPNGGA